MEQAATGVAAGGQAASGGVRDGLEHRAAVLAGLDTSRPNIARVYDYWLGGKDNFAADRELAEKLLRIYPASAALARANRAYVARAVAYAAGEGIGQFLDVGAGLPTRPNVHETAREHVPDARVAYVDNDLVVISHARALLNGLVAVPGDLRDPQKILDDPAVAAVIDWETPVCLVLASVFHFVPAGEAAVIVGVFASRMAPGSVMVISTGKGNEPGLAKEFTEAYAGAAQLYPHGEADIMAWLEAAGLELAEPGICDVRDWRPDAIVRQSDDSATILAAVARRPGGAR